MLLCGHNIYIYIYIYCFSSLSESATQASQSLKTSLHIAPVVFVLAMFQPVNAALRKCADHPLGSQGLMACLSYPLGNRSESVKFAANNMGPPSSCRPPPRPPPATFTPATCFYEVGIHLASHRSMLLLHNRSCLHLYKDV